MAGKSWSDSYKPSLSSGIYGGYVYSEPVELYPKQIRHYFKDQNKEYYSRNKLEATLKHINFNIDVWYKYVSELTFDTVFIPITPKHAQSIMSFYRYKYSNMCVDTLNTDIINNLRELHQIIDTRITQCIRKWYSDSDDPQQNKGVFIRFSNRSPKDGHKIYSNNDCTEQISESKDANTRFLNYCQNSSKDLFVRNGNDAMELILSSERIFSDMSAVIHAHKYPFKYLYQTQFSFEESKTENNCDQYSLEWNAQNWEICNVNIAIRKWDPRLRNDLEFRCFVYNHELRAISQYKDYCYFPELGDNIAFVECIKNKIIQYFQECIQSRVAYRNYVFDIGIIVLNENNKENENDLECVLIELNPCQKSTGSGLFHWKNDERQLKHGETVEIRVHTQSVLTDEFVNQYLNQRKNDKCVNEVPWYQKLTEMETEISKPKSKTKDCVVL